MVQQRKPRLLIVSAVYPFPRNAGQQQRVYYKIRALSEYFHITFLTAADQGKIDEVKKELLKTCDQAIVMPSRYTWNLFSRILHKIVGTLYTWLTGLKFSNYISGVVEFSPLRIKKETDAHSFDLVLYEYWHTYKTTDVFRAKSTPTILDMHDILWRSYDRQLYAKKYPYWLRQFYVQRYRQVEESAWNFYDMLIAINQDEFEYARNLAGEGVRLFYAPMGTDITLWSYCWQPAVPRRVAYYASLGSPHNQQDALFCHEKLMPIIWGKFPETEFWIVGSNPPAFIKELEKDPRIHVTGFIENPQDVLKTMSVMLCPWSGVYGFRSRVVEAMALGVPVIVSQDAVYGMGFEETQGIFVGKDEHEMAGRSLDLLGNEKENYRQSLSARRQVEEKFSYESTYINMAREIHAHIFSLQND